MAIFNNIIKKKDKSDPVNSIAYKKEISKVYEITETTTNRIEPSIDVLINAIQGAKSKIIQQRVNLYDLYDYTMTIDSHVISLVEKRLDNIGNKGVILTRDGETLNQYNEFFQAPKFKKYLQDVVLTQFWGMGLFEFHIDKYNNEPWFDYFKIPIKHINPYDQQVLKQQYDSSGESFKGKDNLMFVGDKDDLGLLTPITLLSIYRRLGVSDYSRYSELASENFTITKYRSVDLDNIRRIEDALANKGKGGSLSVPDGTDIRQENQSSSQQNELFRDYNKMLKEELAILILGQTMTTTDGSSRSQAEVHQEEQDNKFSKDEKYVLDVLNYEFIEYLKLWDIKESGKLQFKFEVNTDKKLKTKLERYKALKELGVVFSDQELRDTFKDII